ncbi:MAG: TolC family protein [Sedimentibacter sp.]
MIKKIGLLLTAMLILTFGITYAEEQSQNKTYNLSMEEAVELGLKNNEAVKIAQLDIEKNQVISKKAASLWSKAPENSMIETKLLSDGYYKRQSEMAAKMSRKSKELLEQKIKMGIKNSYYEISRSIKDIEVKEENVLRVMEQQRIAEAKLKIGTGIKQEVLTAQAAVEEANLLLANAKDDLTYKKMEFNKLLGIPSDATVNFTEDVISNISLKATENIDLTPKVSEAQKNRIEVIQAQENAEVSKLYFDIVSNYSAENTYDYRAANYEKEKANNELNDAKQNVELSVNNAYLNMQKAARAVGVYEKNIASLEEAYRLSQLSYEAGVGVQMDVLNAQNMLYNAELSHVQSLHNYNLAKLKFTASYGIGY